MPGTTEWTFTAELAKWIDEILRTRPDLPFAQARVEVRGTGNRKRRDLSIYGRAGKPILTGELKMPDNPDGRSPFQEGLVADAHDKADNEGVEYFFTSNVNRVVLWKTFHPGTPITERHIEHWQVLPSPIRRSDDVEHPRVQEQIKQFLAVFLERSAAIITGAEPWPSIPLDQKFLFVWEAALEQPVALTLRSLADRYEADVAFTAALDRWMRDEQGWVISHKNDEIIRDNLERAAKLSCYVLANKIVFYKALRRRFTRMRALRIPEAVETGAKLQTLLDECFEHAAEVSRDYETVFTRDYGDNLPFLSDDAVGSWRELVQQTDPFDFTQLDYEIIGQVFERMLSTDERHKFGQHYTRSEVVDLINTFCIRDAHTKVMDPACGGGTFLVRAYSHKKRMSGDGLSHQELLQELYGVDIGAYPAHLTTINLATRDLIDSANYPLVARKDFFMISPGEPIFQVPLGGVSHQIVALDIEKVDAVVGNPPYVRQEKISEYYGSNYKEALRKQVADDVPGASLSGRSDIHCYFFTHGTAFLNDGGYMGLLTSSTWLDTTYGFQLQNFLLDNFEIIAVFESNCEPWFTGARVTTAAVVLRKQSDPEQRAANDIKFVWLTRPLSDLLAYSLTEDDRRMTFEDLRARIESMRGSEAFGITVGGESVLVRQENLHGMRVRVVNQGDLRRLGSASVAFEESDEDTEDNSQPQNGELGVEMEATSSTNGNGYKGFKWGIFLRAPDIFFQLLNIGGSAFVPLGDPRVATIKRGVTTGCDAFFFPRDITDRALKASGDAAGFKDKYGISVRGTDRISVVQAGDGTVHLIEKEYLQPVVFNLMEIHSAAIDSALLRKRVLLVDKPKDELKGTHVLKYIRWGEREGFADRSSCRNRSKWYQLAPPEPGSVFWSMTERYRHVAPLNVPELLCNKRLFNVCNHPQVDPVSLCALLNSTLAVLSRYCFGRLQGGDPVIETEVVDAKMMFVPNPRLATDDVKRRLESALASIQQRRIGHLVDVDGTGPELSGELAMEDRWQLDDAVLELLGITDPAERVALRSELYMEITNLYRSIRTAEKRMQKFRSDTARRGRPTPRSLAAEIWESLEDKPAHKTVSDLASTADAEEIALPEGKAKAVNSLWQPSALTFGEDCISLGHPSRVAFAKALSDDGIHGCVLLPVDPEVCQNALHKHHEYVQDITEKFTEMAAAHSADEQMQQGIVRELWRLVRSQGQD